MASLGDMLVWTVNLVVAIRVPSSVVGVSAIREPSSATSRGECDDLEVVGHAATHIRTTGGSMTRACRRPGRLVVQSFQHRSDVGLWTLVGGHATPRLKV